MANNLRELRVLFEHNGKVLRATKFVFTRKDANIYIFIYGSQGDYYYGSSALPENEKKHTFNYKTQFNSPEIPKISIHEGGQVHIKDNKTNLAGPLQTLPLPDFRGQHLASVSIDNFDGLPEHLDPPKSTGPERDLILDTENQGQSARIVLYANAKSAAFPVRCLFTFTLRRQHLPNPVFIGVSLHGQSAMSFSGRQGAVAIAGWDPQKTDSEHQEFLFLRAE